MMAMLTAKAVVVEKGVSFCIIRIIMMVSKNTLLIGGKTKSMAYTDKHNIISNGLSKIGVSSLRSTKIQESTARTVP